MNLRTFFLILLLANLLLFGYGRGYFGSGSGGEPERLANQIEPDKIRLVTPPSGQANGSVPAPTGPALVSEACRMLNAPTRDQALRIYDQQRQKFPALRITERALDDPRSWWVHLPPQRDRAAADERIAELKRLGVVDVSVMQEEGPNRYAISLGLFSGEQGANNYLQSLKQKGIAGAIVTPRLPPDARRNLEVRGPSDAVEGFLTQLASDVPGLRPAACSNDR